MKSSSRKSADTTQTVVFPQTMHRVRTDPKAVASGATSKKSKKRDNIFSKSRDVREDRGERQMKTTHNPQTFSRSR
jgi:hypothetical protein